MNSFNIDLSNQPQQNFSNSNFNLNFQNNTFNDFSSNNNFNLNHVNINNSNPLHSHPNTINQSNNAQINSNYIPQQKHYPANFDMLFDPALLQISQLEPPKQEETQIKKDHFDFVNDMMKRKNF